MSNKIAVIGRVSQSPAMVLNEKTGKEEALFHVHDKEAKKVFVCRSKINNVNIVENLKIDQMVTVMGEVRRKDAQDYIQVDKCHYERAEKCQEV